MRSSPRAGTRDDRVAVAPAGVERAGAGDREHRDVRDLLRRSERSGRAGGGQVRDARDRAAGPPPSRTRPAEAGPARDLPVARGARRSGLLVHQPAIGVAGAGSGVSAHAIAHRWRGAAVAADRDSARGAERAQAAFSVGPVRADVLAVRHLGAGLLAGADAAVDLRGRIGLVSARRLRRNRARRTRRAGRGICVCRGSRWRCSTPAGMRA